MSITSNRYRTATSERLATVRITVHVSAAQIALALAEHTGAVYIDKAVDVSEDAIRDALHGMFMDGLETAQYHADDNQGEDRVAAIQRRVVDTVFDGAEYYWPEVTA